MLRLVLGKFAPWVQRTFCSPDFVLRDQVGVEGLSWSGGVTIDRTQTIGGRVQEANEGLSDWKQEGGVCVCERTRTHMFWECCQ